MAFFPLLSICLLCSENWYQTMHDTLFNDFLLIGKSSLTAEHERASEYINYGKEVGADVVVVSFQNIQKVEEHFSITERLLWKIQRVIRYSLSLC
ncbi:MAG: hypothetical protein ACR5LA_10170 [Wolbachia sp.]